MSAFKKYSSKFNKHISNSMCVCFFLLTFISSCKKEEKYKGYKETNSGLYYKLLSFGDSTKTAKNTDFLALRIVYKNERDSVFLDTKNQNPLGYLLVPASKVSFKGSFEEFYTSMNEGDSITFKVHSDSLFIKFLQTEYPVFIKESSILNVDVKLQKILSKEAYENELKLLAQLIDDLDIEEQRKLLIYLRQNNIFQSPLDNGLYYISAIEGDGPLVENEKTIVMRYNGYFMDGKKFDTTIDSSLFEFVMGKEDQIIPGIAEGIKLMKQGGKAKLIIPSHLAYGKDGSSTGVVPPYTTLIYDIEIVQVK
ncbi:MAG: FKBP-type peptidyl-prolyl cis-trans isomerase [Bacteroidetes bacterium]|nr:FKBP-type peptidyl-prolyl cis-trans isomerase [Bacteroidota bacterium]